MEDELYFRELALKDKNAIEEYIDEHLNAGSVINGLHGANSENTFEEMLKKHQEKRILPDCGYDAEREQVPVICYLLIRKADNKIIGSFNYRKCLTRQLDQSFAGNIGYGIRPSERKKGYATKGLAMLLEICKKEGLKFVRVGCYDKNIGSKKTIERNGGKLIDQALGLRTNNYYQIDLV